MSFTYQDLEPGYLGLHKSDEESKPTHEFFIQFGDEEPEVVGTILNESKLTLELNPKENPNAYIKFNSKSGKEFTLGVRPA